VKLNVQDETGFFNLKFKIAQVGDIQIQLCQPGEGKSPYKDFLEKKGEGVYHLGFVVDDVDGSEAKLKEMGLQVLSSGRREDGAAFLYGYCPQGWSRIAGSTESRWKAEESQVRVGAGIQPKLRNGFYAPWADPMVK